VRATEEASLAFVLPLLAMTLGHVLSNAVRTLPAIAVDLLGHDLGVTADGLVTLTSAFFVTFAAAQVPLGVALDRFGIRPVSLVLFATVTLGAAAAALAQGPLGFLAAQAVMGAGCAGMLLAPMAWAAKALPPARFGLWSGLILAAGNCGMLLTASPLAWLVEAAGWRAGFWASVGFGCVALLLVFLLLPREKPPPPSGRSLAGDAREVLRLGASAPLRGVMAIAFASFAAVIGVRGLWGGPWLLEVKALDRIAAGHVLLLFTVALCIGPALTGVLDRRFGRRRALLVGGHLLGALCLLALVALQDAPAQWDTLLLFGFGLFISTQPLIFTLTRAAVAPEETGRAMSAVNLSFFLGAAVLQAASGPVGAAFGTGAALVFLAAATLVGTLAFIVLSQR
jgi:predicted MFS family arabinose efflux permease